MSIRFLGQYFDEETGLDYNGARYYGSSTARFPQADPTGSESGTRTGRRERPITGPSWMGLNFTNTSVRGLSSLFGVREIGGHPGCPGFPPSPSYASELEEDSYAEICNMSKQGGALGKKAQQMKKLIEQAARLKGKGY